MHAVDAEHKRMHGEKYGEYGNVSSPGKKKRNFLCGKRFVARWTALDALDGWTALLRDEREDQNQLMPSQ